MTKQEKVCVECKKDLGRYWDRNFCKNCLGEFLNAHLAKPTLETYFEGVEQWLWRK